MRRYILLLLPFIAFCSMQYQAKITDPDGIGITSTLDITFRIFEAPTGGTAIWEEDHSSVAIEKGLFDVGLGETMPLELDFDTQYFMEIEVDGDVMTPRVKLGWSPYSFHALVADSVAGGSGDSDWLITDHDIISAVDRNVVIGSAEPDTMNRLEVTSRALTGSRAVSGISAAGAEGWLGTEFYGAYGQFDSYNYGYLGGSGIGVYGSGDTWAGYLDGDAKVTGDIDIVGNLNLGSLSGIIIGGIGGTDGQVISRTSTGIGWADVEDIASLWGDYGAAMAPLSAIGSDLRVAQIPNYAYGFYATMTTGEGSGYGGYFTNTTTTGGPTGVYASAISTESSTEYATAGAEYFAVSADQVTYGTYTTAGVLDTASNSIVHGHYTYVEQDGHGQMAGNVIEATSWYPSNSDVSHGLDVTTTTYGTGDITGGIFTTEAVSSAYSGIFSGIENYAQSIGKGETYGLYTQIVADNDSANLAQSYGISSAAAYNGKSFLWGVYSWTSMSDTGEVAAFYGQSLKPSDVGFNYGGYIDAVDGGQVRGWYAHATGASGAYLTGNIGIFGYGGASSAIDIGLYARTDDGIGDYAGYFNGTVLATGFEFADLAEMYPDDGDIPDGALVSLSQPSDDPALVRVAISTTPYDPNLVGVRSARPAILMGRSENYPEYRDEEDALWQEKERVLAESMTPPKKPIARGKPGDDEYAAYLVELTDWRNNKKEFESWQRDRQSRLNTLESRISDIIGLTNPQRGGGGSPVALTGRVSVLVTAENGPITPGDPITSSSLPGHGMKATAAGPVIGYALGSLESGTGAVPVNISRGWYTPDREDSPTRDRGTVTFEGREIFVPFSKDFSVNLTEPPIVTISPVGPFTSLAIVSTTTKGFTVHSYTGEFGAFNWIAVR